MDLPAARLCLGDIPGVSPGLARLVLCHVSDNAHEVVGTIAFAYHSVDAPTIALQTEPNSPDRRGAAPVISQTVKAVLGDGYEQTVPAAAVDSSEIFAPTFGSEAWSRPSSGQGFIASRTIVIATSLVVGATRAPALIDGILAVDKRGQMTGGRRVLA